MGTDIACFAERRTQTGWERCDIDFYCGEERNYELFAILADVKRLTNSGFEPIVPPRGFPADSPTVGPQAGAPGDASCHNATWLTLRELLEFPWQEKKRVYSGYVDAKQFGLFRKAGRPQAFSNKSGQFVSNEEMERLIREGADSDDKLTLVSFGIPYADFAGPFLTETLPLLQKQGAPDDVRLIMSFDS
jgi:hypothetical protein